MPSRRLSLFVLANRNTLSDPFRLLMGDVRRSPVAAAFLRTFVFSPPGRPRPGLGGGTPQQLLARVSALERAPGYGTGYSYADELLARALTRQWAGDATTAEGLLFETLERYHLRDAPDPVLHFLSLRLGTPRSRAWGLDQGERLLKVHPQNRWMLFAQASLLAADPPRAGDAVRHYQAVLDLPQQAPDFLHRLFRAWCLTGIAQVIRDTQPAEAARRLQDAIDLKVGGGTEDEARRLLKAIPSPQAPDRSNP
jgi:hypothetical protein